MQDEILSAPGKYVVIIHIKWYP